MCHPAVFIAAAAVNAIGAYKGAKAQRRALEANADIAENNARINMERARDALFRGEEEAWQESLGIGQLKGTQRAQLAARGLSLDGSAARILTDTDVLGAIDVNTILKNSEREAWALREQARANIMEAAAYRRGARDINPGLSAMTSLLGSASAGYVGGMFGAPKPFFGK